MWDTLPDIVRLLLALAFVVGLMGGLALLMKKLGLSENTLVKPKDGKKRLKIIETLPLDSRRRIALIERDNEQHLILLGLNGDTIIETNINSTKSKK